MCPINNKSPTFNLLIAMQTPETKEAINIVIADDLELKATAQSMVKYYDVIEDIGTDFLSVISIRTPEKATLQQWMDARAALMSIFGNEIAMWANFDGQLPDFGEDYQNNIQITANLVPVRKSVEVEEEEVEEE